MVQFRGTPKRGNGVTSGVKVIGVPQALAKLKGVESVVRLDLGLLMLGAAKHMEERAKEYAPVITGNLRSGIQSKKIGSYTYEVTASTEEGEIQSKNYYEYADFVEFGTAHMEGRFFMTRAFQEVKPLVALELVGIARKLERL